jgi:alpha-tubulin suppressor-like RCC1 family protein
VAVANLPSASSLVELVSGAHHNCVRTNANKVGCWGDNADGQLGNGNIFNTTVPSQVTSGDSLFNPVALFSGHSARHTLSTSLTLGSPAFHGWGADGAGQVGAGSAASFRATPAALTILANGGANGLTAGAEHACAITGTGALECWGANTRGQLGYAPFISGMPGPGSAGSTQQVTGLTGGVLGVSASADFTCAVTDGGKRARCWGTGPEGELGNGFNLPQGEPVVVQGL